LIRKIAAFLKLEFWVFYKRKESDTMYYDLSDSNAQFFELWNEKEEEENVFLQK